VPWVLIPRTLAGSIQRFSRTLQTFCENLREYTASWRRRPRTKMAIITDDSYLQVSPEVSRHNSLKAFANWTVSYIRTQCCIWIHYSKSWRTVTAKFPGLSFVQMLIVKTITWRCYVPRPQFREAFKKNALRKGIFYCKY